MYRNTLQRYAKYCTYANKNKYFLKDVMTLLRQCPRNDALISLCIERIFQHSPEATFLFHVNVQTIITLNAAHTHFFLYKNTFFPKKICVCAFFVVPLQPLS